MHEACRVIEGNLVWFPTQQEPFQYEPIFIFHTCLNRTICFSHQVRKSWAFTLKALIEERTKDCSTSPVRKGWETVQPGERKAAQGSFINVYKHLKGGSKDDRARLFLVVSSDRNSGYGHKLKHRKFPLTVRKLTAGDDQVLAQVFWGGGWVSIPGDIPNLGNWLWVALLEWASWSRWPLEVSSNFSSVIV